MALWFLCLPAAVSLRAQEKGKASKKGGKTSRTKPLANTKSLDVRAEQVQTAFVKESEDLASQYMDAGHLEKARTVLSALLAMNPNLPNVQKKIEQIDETLLNANDIEFDVNPSHGWETTGASVVENRKVRFHVEGSYRFDVGASIGAAGFPDADPVKDVVAGIPCGALMGVVIVNGKPGKPFLIGEGIDFTPKESGILAVRVNAPAGNKNTGRLKVTASGWVRTQ
jgi:hypothetical protein